MVVSRHRTLIVAVALFTALTCASSFAQSLPVLPTPDAYVRGTGAIALANSSGTPSGVPATTSLGLFQIDVASANNVLYGGFSFQEIGSNTARAAWIVSRSVKSLTISGNQATVLADGTFNGKPACLTLIAMDSPAGDTLTIKADGCATTVTFYNRTGPVVRGDIAVWQRPAGAGFAKGVGAINVPSPTANAILNVGSFIFTGQNTAVGPAGMISYSEYNPAVMSPMIQPLVRIYVPRLAGFNVSGNQAKLVGPGTLNGHPVIVTVIGTDNVAVPGPLPPSGGVITPPITPDYFSISAASPLADPTGVPAVQYHAEGPLIRGDIMIGFFPPPPAGP